MLSNLPEVIKALMTEILSKIDSQVLEDTDDHGKPFEKIWRIGTVKWNAPKINGQVPLYMGVSSVCEKTGYTQSTTVVRFTDGEVAIVVTSEDFTHGFSFYAIMAHEVGHMIKGHLYRKEGDFVNLHTEEIKKLVEQDLYDEHVHLTSKAVTDGACLIQELEADMEAIKFVGIPDIILMHLEAASSHVNPLARMEKLNRIKHLYQQLQSNHKLYKPRNGWHLDIVIWDADKIKEEAEKEKS